MLRSVLPWCRGKFFKKYAEDRGFKTFLHFFLKAQHMKHVPVCTSTYQYILLMSFHCSVCIGTYWYILVHTGTYCYMLHIAHGKQTAPQGMVNRLLHKGVHTAMYHIIKSHDTVHPALNSLVLPCPGA